MGESAISGKVLLRYLPAAYQEDPESREFLERFLGVFASELDASERLIADIPSYFDPVAVDRPALPRGILSHEKATITSCLSQWLSLDLYELLGDKRNREYLLRATEFYKRKGDCRGTGGSGPLSYWWQEMRGKGIHQQCLSILRYGALRRER